MPRNPETSSARPRHTSRRLAAAAKKGRRVVRTLAQSTLLAAGFMATQVVLPEMDPRYHVFDPTLVDRLQAPITRHHE
jgi:hypothetical protein